MRQRDKRVLFISEEGEFARIQYRAEWPANGIRAWNWNTRVASVFYEQADHTWNSWKTGEDKPALTPKFIIGHHMLTPIKADDKYELTWEKDDETITSIRSSGQMFYFDLDDDVWNIPPWNPKDEERTGINKNLDQYTANVNASSGLIVSTESIGESAIKNGITVPVKVIENSISIGDSYIETKPHKDHDPLRLAYFGNLRYRQKDFQEMAEPLYNALQGLRGKVELWHIGSDFSEDYSIRSMLQRSPVDIVEKPWVSFDKFQEAVNQVDVVLIPAVDHPFNHGRSHIIGLHCAAAGIPFIASPIAEYKKLDEMMPCVYPDTAQAINELCINEFLRQGLGKHNRASLVEYDAKLAGKLYIEMFEDSIENDL